MFASDSAAVFSLISVLVSLHQNEPRAVYVM